MLFHPQFSQIYFLHSIFFVHVCATPPCGLAEIDITVAGDGVLKSQLSYRCLLWDGLLKAHRTGAPAPGVTERANPHISQISCGEKGQSSLLSSGA